MIRCTYKLSDGGKEMFFRILKKELKKKKGVNTILFIFMLLATIFVASSVNNMLVVRNATDFSMEKGKVPNDTVWISDQNEMEKMDKWMKGAGKKYYDSYVKKEMILLEIKNIKSFDGKDGDEYDILQAIAINYPWEDYLSIYNQNQEKVVIPEGYIAMQQREMDRNDLSEGDEITLEYGNYEKTFKIMEAVIDPAFGGDSFGQTRYFINKTDYEKINEHTNGYFYIYCIDTDDIEQFSKYFNREHLSIIIELSKDTFAFTYVMSLVVAGVLSIVGICLIIIAFLVLRFTISVTLQEDYREIGIMKAIGIKDFGIKRLYLVKYLSLAIVACFVGCLCSFPVSNTMIKVASSSMMRQQSNAFVVANILSSIVVLLVVVGFCYHSTNRLRKFSAIEAIRSGSSGERYSKNGRLSLHKHKKLSTIIFMAVNDILSKKKRYVVMVLTFAIGMILIILCANTIATFHSDGMLKGFLVDIDCEAYLEASEMSKGQEKNNDSEVEIEEKEDVENKMHTFEEKLKDKGYDAKINTIAMRGVSIYEEGKEEDARNYSAMQPIGSDSSFVEVIDGHTPRTSNEIVVAEKIMEKMNLEIGDTLCMKINQGEEKVIISGTYQNYLQQGESIMLSQDMDAGPIMSNSCWFYQFDIKNAKDYEDVITSLKKDFSMYAWEDGMGIMKGQIGSTIDIVGMFKYIILVLVCALNMLLTVLMMKLFIVSERGEIAMLRSTGFSIRRIRCWQVLRMETEEN